MKKVLLIAVVFVACFVPVVSQTGTQTAIKSAINLSIICCRLNLIPSSCLLLRYPHRIFSAIVQQHAAVYARAINSADGAVRWLRSAHDQGNGLGQWVSIILCANEGELD